MSGIYACAQRCSIFSLTGLIFLLVIGVLLQKQPLYMKGISDPIKGAQGCYNGALIYFCFFLVSIIYWQFDDLRHQRGFFAKKETLSHSAPPQKMKFGSTYGAVSTK